jgi:hypothetical protein
MHINPQNMINNIGVFPYKEEIDATPWHVFSHMNIMPVIFPLHEPRYPLFMFS